jgi:hypothetical protein
MTGKRLPHPKNDEIIQEIKQKLRDLMPPFGA